MLGTGACNYYDFGAPLTGETEGDTDGPPRDPFFTAAEWEKIVLHSPLPDPPPDPTNRYADDPAAALLGQKLYFDTGYSGSRSQLIADKDRSCASCHDPGEWFQLTTDETENWRNTPTVVNAAFYEWYLWDGGRDSMWAQCLGPPEQQLGSDRLTVVHLLWDKYRDEYNAVFEPDLDPALDPDHPDAARFPAWGYPGPDYVPPMGENPWWSMTVEDRHLATTMYVGFGKAIAAYQRLLISRDAPFDRYVAGDHEAISESAKRGLRLFIGDAACAECHAGPAFTDNEFHNIRPPRVDNGYGRWDAIPIVLADEFNVDGVYSDARNTGRLDGLAQHPSDLGKYRTKHLRQIAETGRYMHAGQLGTLRDVVEFYDAGGAAGVGELDPLIVPLGLSDGEIDDLVAFLETLTGEPIPASLRGPP